MADTDTRHKYGAVLGERDAPELMELFGYVVEFLTKRSALTESVLRGGHW
jgi:hypothetical protein